MMRFTLALALLAGGCARDRPGKAAQEEAPDPRVVEEVRAHQVAWAERVACARSFENLADAEIRAGRTPAWAGTYSVGHMLGGARLTLAPRSGFLLTTWTDMGNSETWTYGSVTDAGSHLQLRPPPAATPAAIPTRSAELLGERLREFDERTYVPVTWGERHFLVEERNLQGFCREIRDGRTPPAFGAFLRDGDEKQAVSGRPRTPDSELRCLDEQPLEAHIIAVRPTVPPKRDLGLDPMTPVVLDVGARDGVRPGMKFYRRGVKAAQLRFTVKAVKERTSEAQILYEPLYSDLPRVGWRLSTDWPPKVKTP